MNDYEPSDNDDEQIIEQQARILFNRAYKHQQNNELGNAIHLYRRSIDAFPTPEAHTFLGWAYSMMSRYEEAIDECKKAIELDPNYGNPYNDIGSYLIELEEWDEAISWLEKALRASNYERPQFAHFNLGRIEEHFGQFQKALNHYSDAIELDPFYTSAIWAKYQLLGSLN